MFVEVAGAVGKLAWEERDTILQMAKKLAIRLANRSANLVIFGTGGVGKTTLGLLLSGNFDPEKKSLDYIESENTEKLSLKSKLYGTIFVGAGQRRRREVTWNALFQGLSKGEFVGIINVVAWGCHSIERLASYEEHGIYKNWRSQYPNAGHLSVSEFATMYLDLRRGEELEALEYIKPYIEASEGKVWMLTIVAKQDLWWDERYIVQNYYQNGEYDNIISSIVRKRGAANFFHEYVSASFKWQNLATDREILKATCAGYDEGIQRANLVKLSHSVRQLVENAANG